MRGMYSLKYRDFYFEYPNLPEIGIRVPYKGKPPLEEMRQFARYEATRVVVGPCPKPDKWDEGLVRFREARKAWQIRWDSTFDGLIEKSY